MSSSVDSVLEISPSAFSVFDIDLIQHIRLKLTDYNCSRAESDIEFIITTRRVECWSIKKAMYYNEVVGWFITI